MNVYKAFCGESIFCTNWIFIDQTYIRVYAFSRRSNKYYTAMRRQLMVFFKFDINGVWEFKSLKIIDGATSKPIGAKCWLQKIFQRKLPLLFAYFQRFSKRKKFEKIEDFGIFFLWFWRQVEIIRAKCSTMATTLVAFK